MKPEDLSLEQRERAEACQTAEELLQFCESEGVELTDEQLGQIYGGKDKPGVWKLPWAI